MKISGIVRRCTACWDIKSIVGGFPACMHIILCTDCVQQVNLLTRQENGKVKCIVCRSENEEAKVAFY